MQLAADKAKQSPRASEGKVIIHYGSAEHLPG
jgi:hypothetical protein